MITTTEAAERYGMTKDAWNRAARRGNVRGQRLPGRGGGQWWLDEADCARYMSPEAIEARRTNVSPRHAKERQIPKRLLGAFYVWYKAIEMGLPMPASEHGGGRTFANAGAQVCVVETEAEAQALREAGEANDWLGYAVTGVSA